MWLECPLLTKATGEQTREMADKATVENSQKPTIVSVIRQRRLALWKSVLTPFEWLNDDPTIACRKTLMGKLFRTPLPSPESTTHSIAGGHQTVHKISSERPGIDTTGCMSDE